MAEAGDDLVDSGEDSSFESADEEEESKISEKQLQKAGANTNMTADETNAEVNSPKDVEDANVGDASPNVRVEKTVVVKDQEFVPQQVRDPRSALDKLTMDDDDPLVAETLDSKSDRASELAGSRDPRSALEKLTMDNESDQASGGGGGWGWNSLSSWGTSVLSNATSSVSTFTNQVGVGLNKVLETVESGLVEPLSSSDEETSNTDIKTDESKSSAEKKTVPVKEQEEEVITHQIDRTPVVPVHTDKGAAEEKEEGDEDGEGWFSAWGLSGISGVVQQTVQQTTSASKKVMTTGLDVLETIGKKTYDILTEGDHGLKKAIEVNRANKPNLSQSLREAKELAEARAKEEEEFVESRKVHFGAQFDDYQGLVQLEALEMLSSMSEGRLKGLLDVLSKETSETFRPQLIEIKRIFEETNVEVDDESADAQNFSKIVLDYKGNLSVNASVQKLLSADESTRGWLDELNKSEQRRTPKEIHQRAVQSLAELTAYSVEHFHRVGQLVLQEDSTTAASFQTIAVSLSTLTKAIIAEVGLESASFVKCLTASGIATDGSVTETITSVYLESSNSGTYVQDAFHLLLPIIQLAVVKSHPQCKELLDK